MLVDEGGGGQVIGEVVEGVLVVGGVRGGISEALVRWQVLELLVELGPGGRLSEDGRVEGQLVGGLVDG